MSPIPPISKKKRKGPLTSNNWRQTDHDIFKFITLSFKNFSIWSSGTKSNHSRPDFLHKSPTFLWPYNKKNIELLYIVLSKYL
jgi:hypothetical protein